MRFVRFLGRGQRRLAGWGLGRADDRRFACVVGVEVVLVSYRVVEAAAVHRRSIMPGDRVLLGVGAHAGRGGGREAVAVADEEILKVVVRGDGYGRQLVDQRRDDLGRGGCGAYVVGRALGRARIRCFDRRWQRVAPPRLQSLGRRGGSGCIGGGGGRANGLLVIHLRRVLHERGP